MLLQQAYGEDAIGRAQVFDWIRSCKGVESPLKATRAREATKNSSYWHLLYSEGIEHNFATFDFFLFPRLQKFPK
jgi:hypothetical protein